MDIQRSKKVARGRTDIEAHLSGRRLALRGRVGMFGLCRGSFRHVYTSGRVLRRIGNDERERRRLLERTMARKKEGGRWHKARYKGNGGVLFLISCPI